MIRTPSAAKAIPPLEFSQNHQLHNSTPANPAALTNGPITENCASAIPAATAPQATQSTAFTITCAAAPDVLAPYFIKAPPRTNAPPGSGRNSDRKSVV